MAELTPGVVFAGHRIEEVAGRGGMGVVYRATHIALDHVVALKVISPRLADDEGFRRRFIAEQRAAVQVRHPSVVPIHHAGEEDGLLFVTMDLIEGVDLRGLLEAEGPLDPEHAAAIVRQVAAALDAAHDRGLVHRDIKPANILIERRDGAERVYLTDFGLTKRIDAHSGVTATDAFVGTIDYVAPEQIRGERPDARTDVYALGCVLFEMLTGSAPYADRDENVAKMYAHLQEPAPIPSERRPGLAPELDEVVRTAMAKDPGERFQSAGELARAAAAGATAPTVETVPPPPTVEAEPPETVVEEPSTVVEAPPPPPKPAPRERTPRDRPARGVIAGVLAGAAALAAVLVAVFVLGGGDDDGGGGGGGGGRGNPDRAAKVDGKTIPIANMPVGVAAGKSGVWVSSRLGSTVSRIDPRSGKADAPIEVGAEPEGMAADGRSMWVVLGAENQVLELDRSGEERARYDVGVFPRGVAVGDGRAWVTNGESDTVTPVGADGPEEAIIVGDFPHGVAVDEDSVWVTNRESDDVSRIDLGSDTADGPITVGDNPKGIALAEGKTWVANTNGGTVSVINTANDEVLGPVEVGGTPRGAVAAFGSVWVANGDGYVSQIDPAKAEVIKTIEIEESSPEEIAADEDRLWVTTGEGDSVVRIDPGTS